MTISTSSAGTPHRRRVSLRVAAIGLLGLVLLGAAGGGLFVWFGLFDVAASSRHSPPAEWFLHFVMERSVAHYAPELDVPDLDDGSLIVRGGLHYASGCAACHGAPGQLASPIAQQMTPVAPGLYSANREFDPSQLFWIIKNGVKMTAMPAWPAPDRTDEIWAMVAFVEHLPELTTREYVALAGYQPPASWLPGGPSSGVFNPAQCASCHGIDGRGRNGAFRPIAGLGEPEVESALRGYRDGSRPSGFMQPIAAQLSDAQIIAAARYYAALPAGAAK